MATKKRASSPTKRRKRVGAVHTMHRRRSPRKRMGALPISVELIGGGVAGAFATRVISANMRPPVDSHDTDLRPYVGIALGLGLMYIGKSNKVLEGVAVGAVAESLTGLISNKFIPVFGAAGYPQAQVGGLQYGTVNGTGNRSGYQYGTVGAHNRRLMNRRRLNGTNMTPGQRFGYDGC